jgi:SAM-dependent methyltransferase
MSSARSRAFHPDAAFDKLAVPLDAEAELLAPAAHEFRARHRFLRALCANTRPTLLDVGCGTGLDLVALSPFLSQGVGIDFSAPAILQARATAGRRACLNLRFAIGDAVAFTIGPAGGEEEVPQRFDLILLAGVLEHLGDARRVLAACRRRLAGSGRLIVVTPHRRSPALLMERYRALRKGLAPPRHLTPSELELLARRAGLEAVGFQALPHVAPLREAPSAPVAGLFRALTRVPLAAFRGAFGMVLRPSLR